MNLNALGRRDGAEEFLTLLQNPFKSAVSFQTNAVWASLATSAGLSVLLAVLFSLFRPRHTVVYAPKVKHADRKHTPPPVGKGFFAWIKPVLRTREPDLVDCIGLDAIIFLRFTKMCRNIFIFISIIGCGVMIPLNISQSVNTNNVNTFATMTPLYVNSKAIWSQVLCAWGFDIIVAFFLWRNYKAVLALRRRYFESSDYQRSLHARTLMVFSTTFHFAES
ncbi:hypothetical protein ARAM_002735 [Aspergillus rambellii]|uniref:CSC1/OSCA1-like N-terminal transmembrane domain-containing protein n=2 Tax=Aspergillus subgen. Nidulantes TaxID=2720870 RepID=A0A0F8WMC1_9EURO|nr:hypothetical protein AOCH_002821 [Aspergillus ochraceoroseus]KKK18860.1 hypothetical protein ARAM_002735 [Aspergillus rambellii]